MSRARATVAVVLALSLAAGARAAGTGTVSGMVVANPLEIRVAVVPAQVNVGTTATATATVRNLGSPALPGTQVTLRADPELVIGGGATRSLAALSGFGSATVSWPVCARVPGNYVLLATATSGAFTSASAAQLVQVTAAKRQCPEDSSATVPAGGTLSTDAEADGATPADPVETSVTTPVAGLVSIAETPIAAPAATAFVFLGQQVQISAPLATPANPLVLVYRLDASIAPASALQPFRNGVQVPDCPGDPCVAGRATLPDGDAQITVKTSAASASTFGTALRTRGAIGAALRTSNGHTVALVAASDGRALAGTLAFDAGRATIATAIAVSGRTAWFAGVLTDRRPFMTYLEDNGAKGRGDVFNFWIAGVAQTTDGKLASRDLTVTG